MMKFLTAMLIFTSFSAMAQSGRSTEGSCGSLGCVNESESVNTVVGVLKSPYVTGLVGSQNIYSIVKKSSDVEQYEITLENGKSICARIEVSFAIGSRLVTVVADEGQCQ